MTQNIHIISYNEEPFRDRVEAGKLLADELKKLNIKEGIVLGIPRGGIIIAREIAHRLNFELDIILSHKLSAPGNPELAIGAITEDSTVFVDKTLAAYTGANGTYLMSEQKRRLEEIKKRVAQFRVLRPKALLKGRCVIVADDGIATGATMQAAVWAIKQEQPQKIIIAVPVSSTEAIEKLKNSADDILCLRLPAFFAAVGQFYTHFEQTEDKEVEEILAAAFRKKNLIADSR